ncbi:penicillin-binding protein 1B [Litorilituus sediminis]|uniref:Penicillin-binding protein 1B n=1 Tax=Litorilituus sediminis TaxID=718192 RepID=A0A4P6P6D5_9GAMM|nr:penicillin-binding protein 1B [Litorilituus sediminis]QBG35739.1 penicillin-binding protein 1B [Litorilituus sediminis]
MTKKTTKAQKEQSTGSVGKAWFRWCVTTLGKLMLALLFALTIFLIYLDAKVVKTFEGQRWQVPAQVYGQVPMLTINDQAAITAIANDLKLNGYKKVAKVREAGEFAQSARRLIVYRRAFDFPSGFSDEAKITIDVEKQRIADLWLDGLPVDNVQLEPKLLARLVPNNKEDRVLVSLEQVPSLLIDTLLLVEDRDFYHHHGVSPLAIIRALYRNLQAGRTVQGGSTLTQQLAKNMFLTRERSLTRKLQEAFMAIILELRYSKDQLLEAYINEVYLGQHYANGIYGFGLAANFYFGKELPELTGADIALLVGQAKGPSYYDPWKHGKRAKQRRDLILKLMFEQNLLSKNHYIAAIESPLTVRENRRFNQQNYPAYLQLVKQELNELLDTSVQRAGIRVFTGFSHSSQQQLEQAVAKQLPTLEKNYKQANLQAAMVVTDIASGEVRALLGSRESGYAGFNRAMHAKRPIGSLIKPAIYLAALERYEQYNFATVLADKPVTFKNDSGDKWQPKNYDGKYRQQVSLYSALINSLNIPTVNLGMDLGLEQIAEVMQVLGYEQEFTIRPSMLLGAINMSPLEVNQLYLPLADQGNYKASHSVVSIHTLSGETLWQYQQVSEQRLSKHAAYLLDYALTAVTKEGTAKSLTWRVPDGQLAGKTGTSNQLRDSWFVGYDDKHLVTTWIGKDDNKPTGLTGSSGALVLFADFIKREGVVDHQSVAPDSIATVLFEQQTGRAVKANCDNTAAYPAVAAGIKIEEGCLQEKPKMSWLERIFGD